MALGPADLRSIAARASTIFERTSHPFRAAVRGPGPGVEARRTRLMNRAAGGDPIRFARYLRWHGWDEAMVTRVLGDVECDADAMPAWTEVLREIDTGCSVDAFSELLSADTPEPFEHAMLPLIHAARQRLARRATPPDACTRGAWPGLTHALRRRLTHLAGLTLYSEFSAFRTGVAGVDRTDRGYDAFIADLGDGGFDRLLLAYPVLARLLAASVLDWVETSADFLRHLVEDAPRLAAFADGGDPGPIAHVTAGLSDPHRGGRTVLRVLFASGLQVIYKPRSLGPEAAFSALLRWLNADRLTLPLKAPIVLDHDTHGWMEYVAPEPCRDRGEVERFYQRAGMLLCLAYVLGGSDLHHGNVMACGEHPVLIDLEAFMNAAVRPGASNVDDHNPGGQQVWDSVLRPGLLPVNRLGLRGRSHRNGGLVELDRGFGRSVPHWTRLNTDLMAMDMQPRLPQRSNLPHVDGLPADAGEHVEAVADGFAEMSGVLQRAGAELLDPRGPLRPFQGVRTRLVLRDTGAYMTLLDQGRHPRVLRDGADWSIEFALLEASATQHDAPSSSFHAALEEQQALTRLDVPLFTARADGTSLDGDAGELAAEYLVESGYAGTRSRLAELDVERTRVHLQGIRLALRQQPARSINTDEAVAIARILRAAAADADGAPGWISIRGLAGSSHRRLQRVGWDLYGGRCGIAILFAALDEKPFAARVLEPLVDDIDASELEKPIGALGAGGIVYGLTVAAKLLQSERLLDAAVRVAATVSCDAIAADTSLDIMSGAAGFLLGLLALVDVSSESWLLDRAICCGRHLLRHAASDWPSLDPRVADGFAHGTAGIAYALARLYRRTGITACRDAALAALQPRQAPIGALSGVSAVRADEMRRSWCQGRTGVGLARLEVSTLIDCPSLREGLDAIVDEVSPACTGLSRSDQVCCGSMGRIAFVSRAADVLGVPRWRDAARAAAARIVARANERGSFAVSAVDDVFCPGYYQGLAGIGYELLRLRRPDLPSVLLWE